jgi:hypothetical protein
LEGRCKWEDFIKMHLQTGCVIVDWIYIAQDRVPWRAKEHGSEILDCLKIRRIYRSQE